MKFLSFVLLGLLQGPFLGDVSSVDNSVDISPENHCNKDDGNKGNKENGSLKTTNTQIGYSNFLKNYYNTNKINTKAKEIIMVDSVTNTIVFAKNEQKKMYPSSMTKMIILYIIFDHLMDNKLTLQDEFTVSRNAHKKDGSKMFLSIGEKVTLEKLINGIVVVSGNDAATTVAENISGSEGGFKSLMQEYIDDLCMTDTNFQNCMGWPDENHYSTAYDIMLLSINLWNNFPAARPLYSQKKFTHNNIKQPTYNDLLFRNNKIEGIKTGHTDAGGYGVSLAYKCKGKSNRHLFLVVNGYKTIKERREDALNLLTFAERNFGNYLFFKKNQSVIEIPVFNGVKKTVSAISQENIILTLDKKDLKLITCSVVYQKPLQLVQKGDKVAVLKIQRENQTKEYDLYAAETIESCNILQRLFNNLKYILLGEF